LGADCQGPQSLLHKIGLDAFTPKYDPYWDIPLNENLPQPVIELPMPKTAMDEKTNSRYCVYDRPHRDYLYTREWVVMLSNELADPVRFKAIAGCDPVKKNDT
jgi:hypothetical protein